MKTQNILIAGHELLACLLLFGAGCREKESSSHPLGNVTQTNAAVSAADEVVDTEKLRFAEETLAPMLERTQKDEWSFPELEDRHSLLRDTIRRHHGFPYHPVISVTQREGQRPQQTVSAFVETNGVPAVVFFVPPLLQEWRKISLKGVTEAERSGYRMFIELALLHELDHLAWGDTDFLKARGIGYVREILIREEALAWAETCKHATAPLVLYRNEPLPRQFIIFYNAWVAAGLNKDDLRWIAFIETQYK